MQCYPKNIKTLDRKTKFAQLFFSLFIFYFFFVAKTENITYSNDLTTTIIEVHGYYDIILL